MEQQPPLNIPDKGLPKDMKEIWDIWDTAAKEFENICGESLQKGDVKNFDNVQRKIESLSTTHGDGQEDKWKKAKGVGLRSLKFLKMLVGAASQASSFVPIPASAANITGAALCFVFDIPKAIKGYNDAIEQVFGEVSSALSQFQIYESMDNVNPKLIKHIHLVMVSFVKICAHVVKYRQGGRERFLRQLKSIFDDDSGLSDEMDEFKRVLQQQRDVEGTITLAVVVESRKDLALLLEKSIIFGKTTEETHKVVQALKDDTDSNKTLNKIRDTLDVPATVRLYSNTTQTCTNISNNCLDGTGEWIWTHKAYTDWTAPKDKDVAASHSHVLLVSGPPSSGKTSASALITKHLEKQKKERLYVAHYFFTDLSESGKKSDDEKNRNPVTTALKHMAFQIARVDATVRNALGKSCDAASSVVSRRSASLGNLKVLWGDLKIGASASGATYYLVFDGIENLPEEQAKMLLDFIFSPKLTSESGGRVRVLVSGTDDQIDKLLSGTTEDRLASPPSALRINMVMHNQLDMGLVIKDVLTKCGMLQNAQPGSSQQQARDKIVDRLPKNVKGSYSRLQFGLDDVIRLLSKRSAERELDRMLGQLRNSHKVAITNLQRSLTMEEISELNELLKWVLYSTEPLKLDQLEAAMFLYSGTESLVSLQYIIKTKYSAVLKLEDDYVFVQDGVKDYLLR